VRYSLLLPCVSSCTRDGVSETSLNRAVTREKCADSVTLLQYYICWSSLRAFLQIGKSSLRACIIYKWELHFERVFLQIGKYSLRAYVSTSSLRVCGSTNWELFTSGVFLQIGNPSLRAYVSKSSFRACGSTSRELFTSGVYYTQMGTLRFWRVLYTNGNCSLQACIYKTWENSTSDVFLQSVKFSSRAKLSASSVYVYKARTLQFGRVFL
jgi:hypothetical protein